MRKPLIYASMILLVLATSLLRWASPGDPDGSVPFDPRSPGPASSVASEKRLGSDEVHSDAGRVGEMPVIDSPIARTNNQKPAVSITLIGRVRNLISSEMAMPAHEITFVVAGKVNRVFVAAGEAYHVDGISPGRAKVNIKARGYEPFSEARDIREAPREQKLDFDLQPCASVLIRLFTPDGRPLLDALRADGSFAAPPPIKIVATDDHPGSRIPLVDAIARSDYATARMVVALWPSDGKDPRGYSQYVDLSAALPCYLSACRSSTVLATRRVLAGKKEVALAVSLDELHAGVGSAHLRVVDAGDTSLLEAADATLHSPANEGRQGRRPHDAYDDLSRTGGDISFTDLEPGAYTLTLSAPGHERMQERVRIEPGQITELGTYRLARSSLIEGTVLHKARAVSHAFIELLPMVGDAVSTSGVAKRGFSDEDGHFQFDGVGQHKYFVRASNFEEVIRPTVVDASGGDVLGLVLQLERGTVVDIRLIPPPSEVDPRGLEYEVAVFDDQHRPIATRTFSSQGETGLPLLPGSCSLEAMLRGVRITSQSFEVESAALELKIKR
jgi:hypothetical protein